MLHKSIVDVGGVPLRVSSDCRGGGGVGGVRSLLKFSSGYAPVSTGLTNSIYHRKKDVKVTLNPPSHSTKSYTRRLRPEVQPIIL